MASSFDYLNAHDYTGSRQQNAKGKSENVWDFTQFDYIVDQARLNSIHIIGVITQYDVPGWRDGNQTKYYPASSQDYAILVMWMRTMGY